MCKRWDWKLLHQTNISISKFVLFHSNSFKIFHLLNCLFFSPFLLMFTKKFLKNVFMKFANKQHVHCTILLSHCVLYIYFYKRKQFCLYQNFKYLFCRCHFDCDIFSLYAMSNFVPRDRSYININAQGLSYLPCHFFPRVNKDDSFFISFY